MGSLESKRPVAEAVTSKEGEQQENGHVKTIGDAAPQKQNGDTVPSNGSAEPVSPEVGSGETIEPASPVNGESKPEEPPGKQSKKKKRFSFKKTFKLGGNPFRKPKKEQPATEETAAGDEAAAPTAEEATPAVEPETAPAEAESAPAQDDLKKESTEAAVPPETTTETPPEETPKPVESTPTTEPPSEALKQE
ncbi:MARCKS-related protein [Bombina bombina]|uniref:MARCKS-related protein n=1 Tax=Bombina bombina TaxID=8345 RepID=UPI00235B007A|nr:MARCKS-related protein [Bombina bombina]